MAESQIMDEATRVANDSKDNSEASSEAKDVKLESWIHSMGTMLGSIDFKASQACSISIVPDHLRKSNEDAYIPKVVSIGPLHRKSKRDLLYMEEIKWRCMLSLLCRTEDPIESLKKAPESWEKEAIKSFRECSTAVFELDEIVRATYLDDIKFDRYDLAKIMLLDGCFLLELLISGSQELHDKLPCSLTPPGPAAEVGKREDILSDLTVLENQIPFVVLNTLSNKLFRNHFTEAEGPRKIKDLALSVLGYSPSSNINADFKAAHLLELFHSFITGKMDMKSKEDKTSHLEIKPRATRPEAAAVTTRHSDIEANRDTPVSADSEHMKHKDKNSHPKLKRCAAKLEAAGVTIKSPDSEAKSDRAVLARLWNWLKNVFKGQSAEKEEEQAAPAVGFDFNIEFSKEEGKLVIPQLHITETTEVRWRNFIAWEQNRVTTNDRAKFITLEPSKDRISCKFSWYAVFFLGLICCVHDVQLLRDKGVIVVHDDKSTDDDKKKKIMSNEDLVTLFRKITEGFEDIQMDMDPHFSQLFKDLDSYPSTVDRATETRKNSYPSTVDRATRIMMHFFRCWLTEIWYFCRKWFNIKALFRDYFPTGWSLIAVIFGVLVSVCAIISTFFPHLIAGMTKTLDEADIRKNLSVMGQVWGSF